MEDQGRFSDWTENVCRVGKDVEGIGGCTKGVVEGGGKKDLMG